MRKNGGLGDKEMVVVVAESFEWSLKRRGGGYKMRVVVGAERVKSSLDETVAIEVPKGREGGNSLGW